MHSLLEDVLFSRNIFVEQLFVLKNDCISHVEYSIILYAIKNRYSGRKSYAEPETSEIVFVL